MTLEELVAAVRAAVETHVTGFDGPVKVIRARDREQGDFASPVLLRAGLPAEAVAAGLAARPGIAAVWVAGPGFLNIRLDDRSLIATVGRRRIAGGREELDVPRALVDAIGEPAARYAVAGGRRRVDPALWTRPVDANPFYFVQSAAASAAAVERWAGEFGVVPAPGSEDRDLLVDLAAFPPSPETVRGLERVAAGYHRMVGTGPAPVGAPSPGRAWLAVATRVALTAGLARLGIAAATRL